MLNNKQDTNINDLRKIFFMTFDNCLISYYYSNNRKNHTNSKQ